MRAAFVIDQRVNLVDDQSARRAEDPAAAFAGQQYVERFRRGDDNVRRLFSHRRAFLLRRVSGSHQSANLNPIDAHRFEILLNATQRLLQIDLNVVAQGLERRNVNDLRFINQSAVDGFPNQIVDSRKKRRERLARTGGRGDQRMLATLDGGPGAGLWLSRSREPFQEPFANCRVKIFKLFHQGRSVYHE